MSVDARTAVASPHTIPMFMPDGDVWQGFARIINHSSRGGTVRIHGTDDTGRSRGPITLSIGAEATRRFNSQDLERGNASRGLPRGLGDGSGRWRLRLESDLDIEVAAYIRTGAGFLASVHDVVTTVDVGGETVHRVPIFNPGSNRQRVSWLRVANLTDLLVDVTIEGRDDAGRAAPGGEVRLSLPANRARHISAQQLESGAAGLTGRFGDGTGKWQLFVTADGEVEVLSLMSTPSGHLTNLSVSGLRASAAPGAQPTEGSVFRDCAECPEMVVVPAGSYRMGSPAEETDRDPDEGPVHRVTISEPFAVGRYEVTFAQWDACHADGGCSHHPDDQGWGRGNRPVVDVSWDDAQEYVRWLSGETGQDYRLLSESEWEYVARAGTTTRYWWGNEIGRNRANCNGCGSRWDARQTAPVGSFSPNAFGLHDVHGNVEEWVQDCWSDGYAGAPIDGSVWESEFCLTGRLIRSGSWLHLPKYLRAATRDRLLPTQRGQWHVAATVGLRVARTLAAPTLHTLALFRPAGHTQQGLARIINRSRRAGTVRIWGTDDDGSRRGPINLRLEAGATRHFNSEDLEAGNAAKGLSGGLGNGVGDWRLELESDLDIEPSAYVRTPDGFLTAMHAVARRAEVGGETVHQVPIFNPGSNRHQVSWLRVANLNDSRVNVTIRARDDAGDPAPRGEVRLTLPANGARRYSAQELESGDPSSLRGRLGDGSGKWRLSVTADGDIEVVSLLQSPTGHLSNLSTTPRAAAGSGGFQIVAGGPTTVRPLQTIPLTVPGGLGESDYTVLIDLSGTGSFSGSDTIEVEGLTTDRDQILTASPMRQALAEGNTQGRLALRVRRRADGALSNVLRLSVEEVTIPAHLSGYPTMLLETFLKAIYAGVGDPLMEAEAASIHPGLAMQSARTLGLDVSVADVQTDAVLEALLGVSMTTLLADAGLTPQASAYAETGLEGVVSRQQLTTQGGLTAQGAEQVRRACEVASVVLGPGPKVCDGIARALQCDVLEDLAATGDATCWKQSFSHMSRQDLKDAAFGTLIPNPMGKVKAKTWQKVRGWLVNKLPRGSRKAAITGLNYGNSVNATVGRALKLGRMRDDPREARPGDRHYTHDASGRQSPTRRGTLIPFDTLVALIKATTRDAPKQTSDVQKDYGSRSLGEEEKAAVWGIVEESDRHQREAENIEDLEGVYTGEQDSQDAIGNNPDRGQVVAGSCEAGYREFVIEEDKVSTCVFESLVEPNCYAGSRRVETPDLGGADVCLYYSLDFFQPNGRCRQNYADVSFQGRRTCRWAELGANKAAWYTLYKAPEDGIVPPEVASCIAHPEFDRLRTDNYDDYDEYDRALHALLAVTTAACALGLEDPEVCRCSSIIGTHIQQNPVRIDGYSFQCTPFSDDPFLGLEGSVHGAVLQVVLVGAGQNVCRKTVNALRGECRQVLNSELLPPIEEFSPLFDSCRAVFDTQVRKCEAHFDKARAKCGG